MAGPLCAMSACCPLPWLTEALGALAMGCREGHGPGQDSGRGSCRQQGGMVQAVGKGHCIESTAQGTHVRCKAA